MIESARKPDWLRAKLPSGPDFLETKKNVDEHKLHTVCQSAEDVVAGEGDVARGGERRGSGGGVSGDG